MKSRQQVVIRLAFAVDYIFRDVRFFKSLSFKEQVDCWPHYTSYRHNNIAYCRFELR
jgi:hypothetical protein